MTLFIIADMFGGIRFYIEQNGVNCGQTFGETMVMPYGYKTKWNYKDFVCSPGLRPFPVWGIAYDADSNQAHSYWPAHSETYTRLVNIENRNDLMEQFIGWVSYWTDLLTCPEGINCYVDTLTPEADDYNSLNGAWQAYSMRAWYEAIVHNVVGVEIDLDGLTFHPYSGAEMSLEGLHYREKIIDIHMKGSGQGIKQITVNGQVIRNADKVSNDILDAKNVIIVERCNVLCQS